MQQEKGIFNFVEEMVEVVGLQRGKDFEIASSTVFTENFDLMALEAYYKSGQMGKVEVLETSNTPFPKHFDDKFVFYKLNEEIDVGLATELGLGVVRMLTGAYSGDKLLYLPFYGDDKKWDKIDEVIAIKVYLQLKHPEIYFEKLDDLVNKHQDLVETIIICNPDKHLNRLEQIFSTHKKRFYN